MFPHIKVGNSNSFHSCDEGKTFFQRHSMRINIYFLVENVCAKLSTQKSTFDDKNNPERTKLFHNIHFTVSSITINNEKLLIFIKRRQITTKRHQFLRETKLNTPRLERESFKCNFLSCWRCFMVMYREERKRIEIWTKNKTELRLLWVLCSQLWIFSLQTFSRNNTQRFSCSLLRKTLEFLSQKISIATMF